MEEIIDGHHLRDHERSGCAARNRFAQVFLEEHHRTAVREDERPACKVPGIMIMVCDLFQKRFHAYKDNLINCQITAQEKYFQKILLILRGSVGDIGILSTFATDLILNLSNLETLTLKTEIL